MIIAKRPDSVIPTKPLVGILMLLIQGSSCERRTIQRPNSSSCSSDPVRPTSNLVFHNKPFLIRRNHTRKFLKLIRRDQVECFLVFHDEDFRSCSHDEGLGTISSRNQPTLYRPVDAPLVLTVGSEVPLFSPVDNSNDSSRIHRYRLSAKGKCIQKDVFAVEFHGICEWEYQKEKYEED